MSDPFDDDDDLFGDESAMAELDASVAENKENDDHGLLATLSKVFGFDVFRHGQEEVVNAAVNGRDSAVFW